MIISQLLASGGIWLNLGGSQILLDPGPGCIIQTTRMKLKPEDLSAIIVSHRHLDHSADVNIMTEAMTQGGFNKHGMLFAPADAFDSEPILFSYLRKRLETIEILEEGKSYKIGDVSFKTPIRHIHGVENYGMVFKTGKYTFSYISDTRYFKDIMKHYEGDLLILNVVLLKPRNYSEWPDIPIDHLSVPEAEIIIQELKPRVAILTHFGMGMWRAKPRLVAEQLSEKTGIRVIAAKDGMKFDLSELENNIL